MIAYIHDRLQLRSMQLWKARVWICEWPCVPPGEISSSLRTHTVTIAANLPRPTNHEDICCLPNACMLPPQDSVVSSSRPCQAEALKAPTPPKRTPNLPVPNQWFLCTTASVGTDPLLPIGSNASGRAALAHTDDALGDRFAAAYIPGNEQPF